MSTYKAIQIQKPGNVEALSYTDLPKPTPGPNGILIKNEVIGVNYIDIYHRSGLYPIPLPGTLGMEAAGVVEAIGSEVKDIIAGDRVVYVWPGSYSEYNLVPRDRIAKIPDSISFKTAATILLQGLTALTMVQESYKVKRGDTVLIHAAAGGVGQQLVRLANHFGATVIGTTSTSEKAEIVRKAGAHHIINYKEEDITKRVQEITKDQGAHAIFDSVGKTTFDISLASIQRLGTLVSFGNTSGPVEPVKLSKLTSKNIRLMSTTLSGFIETQQEFEHWTNELFNLYEQGVITEKIYKIYPFSDIKQAHLDLESGKTMGKLLLTI